MLSLQAAAMPDPHWVDFVLQHFDPTLSVTRTWRGSEAIRAETPDMKSFVLRPATGPVAFTRRTVRASPGDARGWCTSGPSSPTSPPGDPTLVITVKRHPSGNRVAVATTIEPRWGC
jgi:hypothetical protein